MTKPLASSVLTNIIGQLATTLLGGILDKVNGRVLTPVVATVADRVVSALGKYPGKLSPQQRIEMAAMLASIIADTLDLSQSWRTAIARELGKRFLPAAMAELSDLAQETVELFRKLDGPANAKR